MNIKIEDTPIGTEDNIQNLKENEEFKGDYAVIEGHIHPVKVIG